MDDTIGVLRKVFRATNAVFDFNEGLQSIFGKSPIPNEMRVLHKLTLEELEKETPNMQLIRSYIVQMESIAAVPKPNLSTGGIESSSGEYIVPDRVKN